MKAHKPVYEFSPPWYKSLQEIAKVLEVPVKQVHKFPMRKEIIFYSQTLKFKD
jgi:hypothetical protein